MFHTIITPGSLTIIRFVMEKAINNAALYGCVTEEFILTMREASHQVNLEYHARSARIDKEIESLDIFINNEI